MHLQKSAKLIEQNRFRYWDYNASSTTSGWWNKSASYWRNVCNDLRFDRFSVKTAEIGGEQDVSFESAFSNLAHSYLKDKAPKLLDYEVGFQLIEKNNENTKAVGIFGFQLGKQWLYAPVFFLNGDLKGHELLYIKDQDTFVPLKENWVNYLLGRKPSILGESTDRNTRDLGVQQPYLSQLSRSPQKFASYLPHKMKKWAAEIMPDIAYFAVTDLTKEAKYRDMKGFEDFLLNSAYPTTQYILEKVAMQYPAVFRAIENFYPGLMDLAVKKAKQEKSASASVLSDIVAKRASYPLKNSTNKSVISDIRDKPEIIKDKVEIYELEKISLDKISFSNLDKEDKEKLITEGVVIKHDNDPDRKVSQAYNTINPLSLSNPTETGIYDILVKPGDFERCLVIVAPTTSSGKAHFCTVVSLSGEGKKDWININPGNVWVRQQETRESFQKWFDSLGDTVESLPSSDVDEDEYEEEFDDAGVSVRVYSYSESSPSTKRYILISSSGNATVPFYVKEEYEGDEENGQSERYDVRFSSHVTTHHNESYSMRTLGKNTYYDNMCCCSSESSIVLMKRPGTSLRVIDGEVQVPAGFKLIKLNPEKFNSKLIRPGNIKDIQLALISGTSELKIFSDGKNISVNDGKPLDKKSAVIHLVRDHKFTQKTAQLLIDKAEENKNNRSFRCRVKYAAPGDPIGDMVRGAPGAPSFPEDYSGGAGFLGSSVPAAPSSEMGVPVSEMSASKTDQNVYDPKGPDPRSMGVAQQAAQSGQREVFDTAILGGLLKTVRQDNMVDKFIGDLMKGLDRLGRILFIYYWHGDEFEERYGKQDMPELEDSIRNSFEHVGDVVLALKKKSVKDFDMPGINVDLSDTSAD